MHVWKYVYSRNILTNCILHLINPTKNVSGAYVLNTHDLVAAQKVLTKLNFFDIMQPEHTFACGMCNS